MRCDVNPTPPTLIFAYPADGQESRMQHRTQDAGDDDAEKKIWEEKKRQREVRVDVEE